MRNRRARPFDPLVRLFAGCRQPSNAGQAVPFFGARKFALDFAAHLLHVVVRLLGTPRVRTI